MGENRQRILIVDDSPEDRAALRRFILYKDAHLFDIAEAETGDEALDILSSQSIDCVLLDYNLPDVNGLELVGEISGDDSDRSVPVVMMTGQGDETVAVRAMQAGAADYLVKGTVDTPSLQRSIRYAIAGHQLLRELE